MARTLSRTMPQLDGRVTMVISVLVALAPDAVAQQPFVGAGPDGTTLEISGAPVNVNGVDLLGSMAAQNSSMYSQHHRATERMEEVAQSAGAAIVAAEATAAAATTAATALLRADMMEMMVMLATMNSTLRGQIAAQSATIAAQNATLNRQIFRIGQQAEQIRAAAAAAAASGNEEYMSFEWGGHCTIRDGVLNGTNASATICDCSIDVNSDEKLQLLYPVIRNCSVITGDLTVEHLEETDFGEHLDIFANIRAVGGDLIIRKMYYGAAPIPVPFPFTELVTVGGDLILEELGLAPRNGLRSINGMFPNVSGVGESLIIRENPVLAGDSWVGNSFQRLIHTGAVLFDRNGPGTDAGRAACDQLKARLCPSTLHLKADLGLACCPTQYRYWVQAQDWTVMQNQVDGIDYGWFNVGSFGAATCCRSYCGSSDPPRCPN